MAENRLSKKQVDTARYQGKARKLFDGGGLFLHVQASGRYWRLKYRYSGREKLISLGVYPEVSLRRARERRDQIRELLSEGYDPSEHPRPWDQHAEADDAADETLEAVAREWLRKQENHLQQETIQLAWQRLSNWIFPALGHRPIDEIEPPELLKALRGIEVHGKHETAHRVRQRLSQVFRYAIATGRADRDPTADLKGALAPVPTRNRAAVTTPAEAGSLMRAIHGHEGQPATVAALNVLALTFVRPGELRLARWEEFDLEGRLWRVPAERMKMRREHLVPLSEQAVSWLEWLRPVTRDRPYAFEGKRPGRPLSDNTLNACLRTLGYSGDEMTSHGFRAMASTLLHELGWPPEVIELQLAHAQRNQVAAAYNRSARLEERRRMMQAWADYLDSLRSGETNVVPFAARAS